tara:strand:+ start:1388 stop:1534 length:147 start_codon:yes stop_codon:yes gene_type:complete
MREFRSSAFPSVAHFVQKSQTLESQKEEHEEEMDGNNTEEVRKSVVGM